MKHLNEIKEKLKTINYCIFEILMRNLIVILLLFQNTYVYCQSDFKLKTNELSLTLFRFENRFNLKPYNPRLFMGINYVYAIKPKFYLNTSFEGFIHNKSGNNIDEPNFIYDDYSFTFKEVRFLLGYKYLFGKPNQKGVKFYMGNNLFYRNYRSHSEYTIFGTSNIDNSKTNQIGLEQNLGLKIYINQKLVITPEYSANFTFYNDSFSPEFSSSLNLLFIRLKIGILF